MGVHRIGAYHHPVQVEGLEQFPERGDLIGLVCHTCLGKDSARGLVQGRQETTCRFLACAGLAHGLAVHRNDCSSFDGAGTRTEPGPHMSVEVRGVQVLEHPPDGRLRRKSLSALKAQGLQVGGGQVRGVLPYRCQAPATGQHPRHGQGQHRRQVMAYPAPVAGIGKVPENLGQGLARQGGRRGR